MREAIFRAIFNYLLKCPNFFHRIGQAEKTDFGLADIFAFLMDYSTRGQKTPGNQDFDEIDAVTTIVKLLP